MQECLRLSATADLHHDYGDRRDPDRYRPDEERERRSQEVTSAAMALRSLVVPVLWRRRLAIGLLVLRRFARCVHGAVSS
jgi:hypothetical protein